MRGSSAGEELHDDDEEEDGSGDESHEEEGKEKGKVLLLREVGGPKGLMRTEIPKPPKIEEIKDLPPGLNTTKALLLWGILKVDILAGFKKALRPFSVERPKPRSGAYSRRFGSDFGAPPGRISDFWPVTPIFAL